MSMVIKQSLTASADRCVRGCRAIASAVNSGLGIAMGVSIGLLCLGYFTIETLADLIRSLF